LVGFVILLPGIYFLFLVVNFLFKKFLFKEESDTEISGGVMGIIIALILPGFWIYHLVKWLKFRKECQNFASQSQLENEIERERERERERTKNVLVLKVY
jgi:hypothetical protein